MPDPIASANDPAAEIDRQLAAAAATKQAAGAVPNAREAAAVRRLAKTTDVDLRAEHYASVPQKLWKEWSGRQTKQLHDQAQRYGLPFGGATISLPELVPKLHDFLARFARRLGGDPSDVDADGKSANLERMRFWNAEAAQLRVEQARGQWIRRDELHRMLGLFASILRSAGDRLQKKCGREAHAILDEALEDALNQITQALAGDVDPATPEDSEPDDNEPAAPDPKPKPQPAPHGQQKKRRHVRQRKDGGKGK